MESWSYASEGKGFLFSDEVDLPFDPFARNRKALVGWDTESVESMEFIDLGYTEMPKRSFHGNKAGAWVVDGREADIGSSKLVAASPSCMFASNSSLESGSNHSNSLMESNSPESSLIDLKLGRLADCIDAQNTKFSKERSVLSSVSQTFSAKRGRTMSPRSQHPFCQVYGCNKDLTSSKDYHKRHRVCEVHTKTPKVIVNGIEQRFCQQCSRFHLLVEFDDGKRSCRKRLAGHNERRRKPQFAGKPLKFLQSYQGTNFLRTSMPKRGSYLFPSILPAGMLYPGKYEQADFCRHIKLEESSVAIPMTNGQLLPKSFLHLHGNGIQNTSGISSSTTGDFTVFNAAPTIHELAGVSHSSCALSLLSPESQEMSHSVGNTVARSFNSQANRAHYSMGVSDKTLGVGSLGKYVPNGFYSYGMNSIEVDRMRSLVGSDASHTAVLPVALEADGFLQESDCLNPKYCVSPEHGSTLDLLQLSSQLRRVEQQRNSIPGKHKNLDFFSFNSAYGVKKQGYEKIVDT